MTTNVDFARRSLADAHQMFSNGVGSLTLEEALFSAGGYRSSIGVMKHVGGWTHVYRSYAFDAEPRHFGRTSWPRGLRDTIETTPDYLREVVAWVEEGLSAWDQALAALDDEELARPRRLHWGAMEPLGEIVLRVAHHVVYHTGEVNMLLSISRGEAWEYHEEVEENHISTYGHGVRGPWMSDEQAHQYEEVIRLAHEARAASELR